jgi:hypothetical protein
VPSRLALFGAVACIALGACGGTTPARQDRTAAVYTAILRAILVHSDQDAVVSVAPFPDQKSVSLDTQVTVIANLADEAKIRFVDAISEAVDADTAGSPAKEGTVVVLGPVPPAGTSLEVEAERYESEAAHTSIRFQVNAVDDQWHAELVDEHTIPPSTSP